MSFSGSKVKCCSKPHITRKIIFRENVSPTHKRLPEILILLTF